MSAENPIAYYGPAETDLSGVLHTYVRQPCDQSPAESNGVPSYREQWKSSYDEMKDILTEIKSGDTLTRVHQVLDGFGEGKTQRYSVPACPVRNGVQLSWILTSINVQELEAGAHAILELMYEGRDPNAIDPGGEGTDVPDADVWSVQWQAYQVSPWNFCKNEYYSLANYAWSPSYDSGGPSEDWTKPANRAYINMATTSPSWEVKAGESGFGHMVYAPNLDQPNDRRYLPVANSAVYKKVALGRNATYHYPVITHQTASQYPLSASVALSAIGNGIDHIDVPSGCPYELSGYQFVKVGDDISESKSSKLSKKVYTRRQVWWGFAPGTIDVNYYGNGTFSHDESGILSGRWPLEGV